jgi:hypothetical protein
MRVSFRGRAAGTVHVVLRLVVRSARGHQRAVVERRTFHLCRSRSA